MASNAGTWFYETPQGSPYLLQERVNSNLWMARLWNLYFVTEQAQSPYRMSTRWGGQTLVIEWEPRKWLRLIAEKDAPTVLAAFSNILHIPATLTYTHIDGKIITEWHRDGGEARWHEIQGNPTYQSPVRFSR
jgi:hypothetical protein